MQFKRTRANINPTAFQDVNTFKPGGAPLAVRVLWQLFRLMHPAECVVGIPRGTESPYYTFHPSGSTKRVALTCLLGPYVDFGST